MKHHSIGAGTKRKLIKPYEYVLTVLTIALAAVALLWPPIVADSQEPTYDYVEQVTPVATTSEKIIHFAMPDGSTIPRKAQADNMNYSTDKEYIVQRILEVFPEAPIMVQVAMCESGLHPQADRENRNVDVGLFQINQVHLQRLSELGLDRRDLEDNLTFARMLYEDSGLSPWYMSEHCWSVYL